MTRPRRTARARGADSATGRAKTPRQLRVGEELRHVLAQVLERGEMRDPDLRGQSITVTEGLVKRGAKVRLLRDNTVIHEGTLKTLKRFKDEVREVGTGFECGMAFENYEDIREGDIIECFDVEEIRPTL